MELIYNKDTLKTQIVLESYELAQLKDNIVTKVSSNLADKIIDEFGKKILKQVIDNKESLIAAIQVEVIKNLTKKLEVKKD